MIEEERIPVANITIIIIILFFSSGVMSDQTQGLVLSLLFRARIPFIKEILAKTHDDLLFH